MKTKKIIKLINNERLKTKVASEKGCTESAIDICTVVDFAHCTTHAYDQCYKDYDACSNHADDVCYTIDTTPCSGPGEKDFTR